MIGLQVKSVLILKNLMIKRTASGELTVPYKARPRRKDTIKSKNTGPSNYSEKADSEKFTSPCTF